MTLAPIAAAPAAVQTTARRALNGIMFRTLAKG
jgi:hypothetical protein